MNTIHIYCRVSTDDQAKNGWSLDAQRDQCGKYAQFLVARDSSLEIGNFYVDEGVSASKVDFFKRPQGRELAKALRPGDHVVFARLDRSFRSLKDFSNTWPQWQARGIKIHFMDLGVDASTATGELIINIMVAVAQWESKTLGERIRAGNRAKKERVGSSNPRAVQRGKKAVINSRGRQLGLVRDDEWHEEWELAKRLREEDGLSWPQISDELERLIAQREGRKPYPRVHFKHRRKWSETCLRDVYSELVIKPAKRKKAQDN